MICSFHRRSHGWNDCCFAMKENNSHLFSNIFKSSRTLKLPVRGNG
jgi:hypothetical protein